jgi:hypothetical protein
LAPADAFHLFSHILEYVKFEAEAEVEAEDDKLS